MAVPPSFQDFLNESLSRRKLLAGATTLGVGLAAGSGLIAHELADNTQVAPDTPEKFPFHPVLNPLTPPSSLLDPESLRILEVTYNPGPGQGDMTYNIATFINKNNALGRLPLSLHPRYATRFAGGDLYLGAEVLATLRNISCITDKGFDILLGPTSGLQNGVRTLDYKQLAAWTLPAEGTFHAIIGESGNTEFSPPEIITPDTMVTRNTLKLELYVKPEDVGTLEFSTGFDQQEIDSEEFGKRYIRKARIGVNAHGIEQGSFLIPDHADIALGVTLLGTDQRIEFRIDLQEYVQESLQGNAPHIAPCITAPTREVMEHAIKEEISAYCRRIIAENESRIPPTLR